MEKLLLFTAVVNLVASVIQLATAILIFRQCKRPQPHQSDEVQ